MLALEESGRPILNAHFSHFDNAFSKRAGRPTTFCHSYLFQKAFNVHAQYTGKCQKETRPWIH